MPGALAAVMQFRRCLELWCSNAPRKRRREACGAALRPCSSNPPWLPPVPVQLEKLAQVSQLCREQLHRVEEERAGDARLDRHLWRSCSRDMQRFCKGVELGEWVGGRGQEAAACPPAGRVCADVGEAPGLSCLLPPLLPAPGHRTDEGRMEECLQDHQGEPAFSDRCREAVEGRMERAAADYELNYGLRWGWVGWWVGGCPAWQGQGRQDEGVPARRARLLMRPADLPATTACQGILR